MKVFVFYTLSSYTADALYEMENEGKVEILDHEPEGAEWLVKAADETVFDSIPAGDNWDFFSVKEVHPSITRLKYDAEAVSAMLGFNK